MGDVGKRVRSWQELAAEASRERDPKKRDELAIEVEPALDVRDRKLTPQPILTNKRQQSA